MKRDTTYRNPSDPEQELSAEEKVKGYRYGPHYVPITDDDAKMFKVPGAAGITVLGFVSEERVPRHHLIDAPIFVHGSVESEVAKKALVALSMAMDRTKKVALARYVKAQDADPYLCGLFPWSDEESGWCLLLYRLPCCEDVREYAFPSLSYFAEDGNKVSGPAEGRKRTLLTDLVDAMSVSTGKGLNLTPVNPVIHTLLGEVHRRIVEVPKERVIPLDNPIVPKCLPPPTMAAALSEEFKLAKVEGKASKRKIFWSDVELKSDVSGSSTSSGRVKYEIDVNFLASNPQLSQWRGGGGGGAVPSDVEATIDNEVAALPSFSAGSVNPIEDFEALIASVAKASASVPSGLATASSDEVALFQKRLEEVVEGAMVSLSLHLLSFLSFR